MTDVHAGRSGAAAMAELPVGQELWERVVMVAPLAVVGTREGDGWDFAPKHMAMPLGWEGYYAFACTPRHGTYRNLRLHPQFTVSFPRPDQVFTSSFTAGGRAEDDTKPSLAVVPTVPARVVEGMILEGCYLALECELDRIVDGFGHDSLVVGRVVAASAAPDALRGADTDDADLIHRLGLLAYLAPGRFAVVRDSLSYPFPHDFRR